MDQFPLYPFDSDPLRIASPRRIREQSPAPPPEAPPAARPEPPPDPGPPAANEAPPPHRPRPSADIPDAAYWPPRSAPRIPPPPGEGDHPQDGGEAPSTSPEAASPEAASPEAAGPEARGREDPPVSLHPDPAGRGPPPPKGEDERIRLMREWINRHWDTVEAMARAGEAPQRPPPEPDPEPERPPPPIHVARADRWTKPKMAEFLRRLAATHSVSAAAQAVGMSRQSAYRLRARLKGQPFDVAWEAAFLHGYDNLAHAALDRALNGVEVPHYHEGKLIGTSRKFDERLTVALLAMRNRLGAPLMGRYGALAEYHSERWDALLARVETGSVDWSDEHRALGPAALAQLGLPDESTQVDALIEKHAPEAPRRGRGG